MIFSSTLFMHHEDTILVIVNERRGDKKKSTYLLNFAYVKNIFDN